MAAACPSSGHLTAIFKPTAGHYLSAMARKRRSRRNAGYRYLPVDETLPVGNLATKVVIADDLNTVVDQDTWLMSAALTWGAEGFTAGEGPIQVGLAHGDYTAAEIEECLESLASWDQGDKIANERRRRKVRIAGSIDWFDGATGVLAHGRIVKTKLGFMLEIGETLKTWAYNPTTGTIATGGQILANGGLHSRRR